MKMDKHFELVWQAISFIELNLDDAIDVNDVCDFFTPRQGGGAPVDKAAALRAAVEALFKKS